MKLALRFSLPSFVAGAAFCVLAIQSTFAAQVLTVTSMFPDGAPFQISIGAVDFQPVTVPILGPAAKDDADQDWSFFGANNVAGFDFGENFANLRITNVYIFQASWNSGSADDTFHWSNDNKAAFEAENGDVAAPDFNIINYTGTGGNPTWISVYTSATPGGDTPQGRYLMMNRGSSGDEGNFKYEVAFIGEVVPEPASLGLLAGVGAFLALRRNRRA